MKNFFIAIVFFVSNSYAQTAENYCKYTDSIAEYEMFTFTPETFNNITTLASQNFDVNYYRCEWKVDPAVRYISGKVTCYFSVTANADTISFDLADGLVVDSIKQRNFHLSFGHLNNQLNIYFNTTLTVGGIDSVSIYYQGVPANAAAGSFVNALHEGIPILWTLSEPYGSRNWWPCKDGLDDKADSIDVFITTPSQYKSVSNGVRQQITTANSEQTAHWKHRYPIASYLVCMAVTNYEEFDLNVDAGGNSILMQTFCYPESLPLFKQNTPKVLNSLQYFSNIFGDYPFKNEKYGHVQFGWGGGQEHQTSTFLIAPNENLMSHELAHQWFGDKVTCGSWHDIWLNEGFATHLASMDYEQKYPLTVIDNRKLEIEHITSIPDGAVWVDDTTNVSRIFNGRLSYRKGSHVLYMLRWILGDNVFFEGARDYLNDPQLQYGFAKTEDLKRILEKVSGKDLTDFFSAWIYGEGYPSYQVAWSQQNFNRVKIILNQKTSHPSVSFFALPVALQFKNATQDETVVLNNTRNGEVFFEDIGFLADTVIVDPDYWLITKDNTSQKLTDNNIDHFVQVFPNPFRDQINIYLNNFSEPVSSIKIFDTKGSLISNQTININGSAFETIDLSKAAKGVYILKLMEGNSFKFVRKIIKQ